MDTKQALAIIDEALEEGGPFLAVETMIMALQTDPPEHTPGGGACVACYCERTVALLERILDWEPTVH